MSAGDAGPAGDAQGQGEGEGQAAEQQGPDYGALSQQLEQQGQSLDQLREYLQSNPWAAQDQGEEQGQEEQPLDLGFMETGDPQFDQELAQNLQSLIQSQVDQGLEQKVIEKHLRPMQERLQTFERMDQARELTAEFPELNDAEHAQRVIGMSREYAEMMGKPELADEPAMWRLMHLANAAMVAAKEEEGNTSAAHVEGAGAAGGGQQSQVDLGDLIVNGQGEGAPLGRRALPF
jgi:hypothetical protein